MAGMTDEATARLAASDLGLGNVHHLGWVVRDAELSMLSLAATLGVGPFHVLETDTASSVH